MVFKPLNLPLAQLKLKRKGEVLFVRCIIRNKEVVLTPEEWVRQHIIHYLIQYAGYQKGKIAVEYALKYNGTIKRCDILIFNDLGTPLVIMECKAPEVMIDKTTFYQAAKYDHALNVSCLMISNGLVHFSVLKTEEGRQLNLTERILPWEELKHC
jgi:hypothetical protein